MIEAASDTSRPRERIGGHLPIEDHGLLGDGSTCALRRVVDARHPTTVATAQAVGVLAERVDPSTGRFLGDLPPASSRIGATSTGMDPARELDR